MNIYWFNIMCPKRKSRDEFTIRRIIDIAGGRGYSYVNSYTGKIDVMKSNGIDDFAFSNLSQAVAVLVNEGGLLNLWQDAQSDIGLSFRPGEADQPNVQDSVSLNIESLFFESENQNRNQIATDIQTIYSEMCVELDASYGYSADENALELFWEHVPDIEKAVGQLIKPPILFWLNYFSTTYWARIDSGMIKELGGEVEESQSGVQVKFFAYPWDVNLDRLRQINKEWWS